MTSHSAQRWRCAGPAAVSAVALGSVCQDAHAREIVAFESSRYPIGSIVVDTAARRLYRCAPVHVVRKLDAVAQQSS